MSKTALILSNEPSKATGALEMISEAGVSDEVAAVRGALDELGYRVCELALSSAEGLIGRIRATGAEVVFNLCEGLNGDSSLEMDVAGLLELSGIPFTGNCPLALGIARNKPLAKSLFRDAGLNVAAGALLTAVPDKAPEGLSFPIICKPAAEDASLGIGVDAVTRTTRAFIGRVKDLLDRYPDGVLAEEYIDGREFNVAVRPDGKGGMIAMPPSEIDFTHLPSGHDRITSYEAKWITDSPVYKATPPIFPARVTPAFAEQLQDIALTACQAVTGDSYGRADLRAVSNGHVFILEFNPNPDISLDAGFAKALIAAKTPYPEFVADTIGHAFWRRQRRRLA